MYAVNLTLKNEKKVEALIYSLPEDGVMRILVEPTGSIKKLRLSEIKEGTIYDDHYRVDITKMDFFHKCRVENWIK